MNMRHRPMWYTSLKYLPSGHLQKNLLTPGIRGVCMASGPSSVYIMIPSFKVYFVIFCAPVYLQN